MNDAHLHLLINHFSIILPIIAVFILLFGLISKNNSVKNTSYVLFIIATVFGVLAMQTGDGAEKIMEKMQSIDHNNIDLHEEIAENFILLLYTTGFFSLLAFYTSYKRHATSKLIAVLAFVLGLSTTVFSVYTGLSGGRINHQEIRENNKGLTKSTAKNNISNPSMTIDFYKKKQD